MDLIDLHLSNEQIISMKGKVNSKWVYLDLLETHTCRVDIDMV